MAKYKIMIDPGHGGKDQGAIGKFSKEKDLNLVFANKLCGLLKSDIRFNVSTVRTSDEYITLSNRVLQATEKDVDVFLSIHCNASELKNPCDCQVYYYHEIIDKPLADLLFAYIDNIDSRTSKWSRVMFGDYYVLRKLKLLPISSVLVEVGFISNEEDEKMLNDEKFQDDFCTALFRGIKAYFNAV